MKKIALFLTALCLAGISLGAYFVERIQIYSPPLTLLTTTQAQDYQQKNAFCHQAKNPVAPFSANKINLLVWNLHKGADQGWQQDLTRFAQSSNLMLLQEATDKQQLAHMLKAHFSTAFLAAGFRYENVASGVEILANSAPDMYCAGTGEEPWLRIPKVAQALRFPLPNGESLLVVNVHLVNFEWTPDHYRKQLTAMMARIAEHKSAVVLAGDFNSWNQERLQLIRDLAAEQGLNEVSFDDDQRLRFFGQPLDHVFVRGLLVKQARTEAVKSSDHNPLRVELEWVTPPR